MGLDTTHDCWHGSYSAFTRWRNTIAEVAGYSLMDPTPEEQARYCFSKHPMIEWDGIENKNYRGDWSQMPGDPLIVLIAHSDCDGVIHPEHGRPLADRLEGLLP